MDPLQVNKDSYMKMSLRETIGERSDGVSFVWHQSVTHMPCSHSLLTCSERCYQPLALSEQRTAFIHLHRLCFITADRKVSQSMLWPFNPLINYIQNQVFTTEQLYALKGNILGISIHQYFSIFREKNLGIVCYTSIWLEDTQYTIFTIYR